MSVGYTESGERPEVGEAEQFKTVFRIKLGRHGEKDEREDLTPGGVSEAEDYGEGLGMQGVVHEVTSDIPRAKQSGDLIVGKLLSKGVKMGSELWGDTLNVKKVKASEERQRNHQTYIDIFNEHIRASVAEIRDKEHREPTEEEMKQIIDEANELGVKANLADPVYVNNAASRYAYLLDALIQRTKNSSLEDIKDYQKEGINFVVVSHGSMLESFLKKTLIRKQGGREIKGFEDVEEIGGVLKPTEFYEINIMHDGKGKVKIGLTFDDPNRAVGFECELDGDEIARLGEIFSSQLP